jgi:hypothetical protein
MNTAANQNDNLDLEKIKDRIAKLLRMADDAGSPNEAAIAAGRARALMDKYQIAAFDAHAQVKDSFSAQGASIYFNEIPAYMSSLAVSVAKYNDCQARYEKAPMFGEHQGKQRVTFQGYTQDVEFAIQMYKRLLKICERLACEYVKAKGETSVNAITRLKVQFKYGAMIEINNRLHQMTAERDAITSSAGTSLVIVKAKGVEGEFGKVNYGRGREVTVSTHADAEARRQGHVKGATIEITPSVK